MLRFIKKDIFIYFQVGRSSTRTFSINRMLFSEEKYLEIKEDNGVRIYYICKVKTLILNHPESRNSLSLKMLKSLLINIKKDEDSKNLRSIVIKSGLERVFSAGHNLKELTGNNEKLHKEIFETCSELMRTITQSPVPIIVAVDGIATAAGCQLVTACDIAICTEQSSFATPGANLGIFCSTPGFSITGKEAYEAGLVSKVVQNDKFEEEIEKITTSINMKSRSIIHVGKTFLYEQLDLDMSTAYFLGTEKMINSLKMKDAQEGIKSFIEKRKPIWSHDYEKN
ncbi:enoyl-CoA hydratase domain-containing protein 3, mitochondrial isoform X3 [Bombus bifarius]|uniref:Enoyl-CoA hydratase domain-containing protein 3, mitochondrial n=1 Tax=Bombus bifarius TaxID=103933 RepID=A0A6P8MMW7_9HYME|nr:enoyl-CoA hydratase domain-containing protein 3, mitochondrial isoform X3 [Bombus vancouverensis nearcticus]XP_033309678.1 enoyl-CoA hydratase domain-containing protein 3, mitochondrial isoform X3 [Bombus bifarius]